MGLSDRDYYRDDQPAGWRLSPGRSMVLTLIIINAVAYLANMFLTGQDNAITRAMRARPETLTEPWMWWQFVTYGFVHSPSSFNHILFNMFGLWVFGRDVEARYGRWEFLRIYLTVVVLGGVIWALREYLVLEPSQWGALLGASGGVFAVITLFICNFPNRTILFMFILPMKAWVLGVLYLVGMAVGLGSMARGAVGGTAHDVHLVGLLFGLGYFFLHWNLRWMMPSGLLGRWRRTWKRIRPGAPNLRVHTPEADDRYREMDEEADRLLDKVHREGESSLSDRERRLLEAYSRRMRQKHR